LSWSALPPSCEAAWKMEAHMKTIAENSQ
jgi:hypothetical protein